MFEPEDLKSIILLSYLDEAMLKKIGGITATGEYRAGDYIFKEGDYAMRLYSVIDGKVGLELEKDSSTTILIDTITRGMTFGFSSLIDTEQKKYTTNAKALTHTKVFIWKGVDLEKLFYQDFEMGFLFMKRIAKIAKTRLQNRNAQLLDIYG